MIAACTGDDGAEHRDLQNGADLHLILLVKEQF